jgi:hypothetical protein
MLIPRQQSSLGLGGPTVKTEVVIQGFFPPVRATTLSCGEFKQIIQTPSDVTQQ